VETPTSHTLKSRRSGRELPDPYGGKDQLLPSALKYERMITIYSTVEKDANSIGYRPAKDSNTSTIKTSSIVTSNPTSFF
jgi:hypothetical protein